MADLRSPEQLRDYESARSEWPSRHSEEWPVRQSRSGQSRSSSSASMSSSWTWLALGAGVLAGFAVYHFGPDFRRYLKIKRM